MPDTGHIGFQENLAVDICTTGGKSTPASTKSTHMVDINFPHKTVGYKALESTDSEFIGLDSKVVQLNDLDQYMAAAKVIRVPNYGCARIPISSDLNIHMLGSTT